MSALEKKHRQLLELLQMEQHTNCGTIDWGIQERQECPGYMNMYWEYQN
jgi:hypothetical protein